MTRTTAAMFALLVTCSTSSAIAQSNDPIDELKACTEIADNDARLGCFDNLGQRVLRNKSAGAVVQQQKSVQPAPVATAAAASAPSVTASVSGSDDTEESEHVEYSGAITACTKGSLGDWYFTLDNGQVWKDVNRRIRRVRECNSSATIFKGSFGYKMRIDALDRTISVRRQK